MSDTPAQLWTKNGRSEQENSVHTDYNLIEEEEGEEDDDTLDLDAEKPTQKTTLK